MITFDPEGVIVRPAATVMLVRDTDLGPEVFMLRRNPASDFVAGAMVFPGGAVDPGDSDESLVPFCAGLTDPDASEVLDLPAGGLAFWVAAIRETFEEAGVLLAYDQHGDVVRFDDPGIGGRFSEHRRLVDSGLLPIGGLCADEQLTLACDTIHYVSHWVTPVGPSRRYDTRFFIARAPEAQVGAHDNRETVASLWVRPQDALSRAKAGDLDIIMPTASNLEWVEAFDSVDDLMAASRPARPHALPHALGGEGAPT